MTDPAWKRALRGELLTPEERRPWLIEQERRRARTLRRRVWERKPLTTTSVLGTRTLKKR